MVNLKRFKIFVDGELRFIKNTDREKDNLCKLLSQKGIKFDIQEEKLY
jgi:hypothetical protein